MNKKDHNLTPLKDIISNLLNDSDLPFNPADARIWEVWGEVVGTAVSTHAQPSRIKNGRLRVDVTDPIWLLELEFAGEEIKDKLNTKLGRKAIDKIEFRLGTR